MIVKMEILPKSDLQFQCNLYENPNGLRNGKANPNIHNEWQGIPNSQNTLNKKKSKVGGLMFPNFKTYHKAKLINTVLYWHKDRHIEYIQWNKIEFRNKPIHL